MERKTYYDAEPWYQREKTRDWYQQMETSNVAFKRKLAELITAESIITEVACGGGWLAEFIATLRPKAYRGFDFAGTAAKNASARLKHVENFHFFEGDALSPASYSPDANLVVSHQFLHCLVGNDRFRWMALVRESLEHNGGSFLLSSMIGLPDSLRGEVNEETKINRPGNRYYAEDEEIQSELRAAGFQIAGILYPEPHVGIYQALPTPRPLR